jgi:hypothetical protein
MSLLDKARIWLGDTQLATRLARDASRQTQRQIHDLDGEIAVVDRKMARTRAARKKMTRAEWNRTHSGEHIALAKDREYLEQQKQNLRGVDAEVRRAGTAIKTQQTLGALAPSLDVLKFATGMSAKSAKEVAGTMTGLRNDLAANLDQFGAAMRANWAGSPCTADEYARYVSDDEEAVELPSPSLPVGRVRPSSGPAAMPRVDDLEARLAALRS